MRLPPHNLEAEQAVLGAVLLNPDCIGDVAERLEPADFYEKAHAELFSAMLAQWHASEPIDPVALYQRMGKHGELIASASSAVPTSANATYYARLVREAAVLRQAIDVCAWAEGRAYAQPELQEYLDTLESKVYHLTRQHESGRVVKAEDALDRVVARLRAIMEGEPTGGVDTGYPELDSLLEPMQPGQLLIVAARPGIGKTALGLNIAYQVASRGTGVQIYSLEMGHDEIVGRLVLMTGQLSSDQLKGRWNLDLFEDKVKRAEAAIKALPLWIDDTEYLTATALRARLRRQMAGHHIGLVVVDYLQLMNSGRRHDSRQAEVAEISRTLKRTAREMGVPMICACQLNRLAEEEEPRLSHLRESGAIEQDADVVMLLGHGERDRVRIHIAKQRAGQTGHVDLQFHKQTQRFISLESPPPPPGTQGEAFDEYQEEEGVCL